MQDLFIDTDAGLAELCARLRGQPVLALDTEFMREKTYYAQLCLLQVAGEGVVACVDPLAVKNLDPLLDLLYDPAVTKVLHAARQDLEIFFDLRGELPRPVFDTQIAATLLGHGDQIGYANLVQQMLGVELDKLATRTDWSRRPLAAEQLRYAEDDVRYLFQIYHQQVAQLRAKGRLDWLAGDFADLTARENFAMAEGDLWARVRGTQRLKGAQLAILRDLAVWRERRAQQSNRPRRWVLKDEAMVEMARRMPSDIAGLEAIRDLEAGTVQKHGAALLELIQTARATPPHTWPRPREYRRLTPTQDALVDALMAVLRLRAQQAEVSPALLATRKDLEALVGGATDSPVLHGWRGALVGHDLRALLDGEQTLAVQDGELRLQPAAPG